MTLRYLLDTNAASNAMDYPDGPVARKIANAGQDTVGLSIIVAGEILFGLAKNPSVNLLARIDGFLCELPILPLEGACHARYAEIRADFERRGVPIGANDLWIAAHALALDLTLVTANIDEFSRVPGLRIENWLQ